MSKKSKSYIASQILAGASLDRVLRFFAKTVGTTIPLPKEWDGLVASWAFMPDVKRYRYFTLLSAYSIVLSVPASVINKTIGFKNTIVRYRCYMATVDVNGPIPAHSDGERYAVEVTFFFPSRKLKPGFGRAFVDYVL